MSISLRPTTVALLLLVLLLAGCATLQQGGGAPEGSATIHGTVKEAPSALAPVTLGAAGISVSVEGTAVATHIDADGSFTLQGVPSGDITLLFETRGGEVRLQLGGIMPNQTIRLSVALSETDAAIDAISRSIDDLTLSMVPDVWELGWAEGPGEPGGTTLAADADVVSAFVHGASELLSALDDDCFDLAGDDPAAGPLVPATVIRDEGAVEVRFGRADVLALLLAPEPGNKHEVRLGVCFVADDADTGASTGTLLTAEAETYELVGQISIADDEHDPSPDFVELSATLDPDELPLEPDTQAEDDVTGLDAQGEGDITTVRLVITGDAEDLASVSLEHITLGFDDEITATDAARVWDGADTLVIEATFSAADVIGLIDEPVAGAYTLWLELGLAPDAGDEVVATGDAEDMQVVELEVSLTLTTETGSPGDDDLEPLSAEWQPSVWNTNWARNGRGWVTVKIRGDGFDTLDLDAISVSIDTTPAVEAMSVAIDEDEDGTETGTENGTEVGAENGAETEPLVRERAQRQGNHVRAYFYQRDVIGLIDDPVPGTSYEILLHVGDEILPATIRVTGPPH